MLHYKSIYFLFYRMKVDTPEISWHGRDPIYSIDFQQQEGINRVATAGADKTVRVSATCSNLKFRKPNLVDFMIVIILTVI